MAEIHPFFHFYLPNFWLVAYNSIGNLHIDSSLSPKYCNSSLTQLKNGLHSCMYLYKQICQNYVTRHLKSLMLGIHYSIYCDSTLALLNIHYLFSPWITQHGLSTWHFSDLAYEWLDTWVAQHSLWTQYALWYTCCAPNVLLV